MLSFSLPLCILVTAAAMFWFGSYRQTRRPGVGAMCTGLVLLEVAIIADFLKAQPALSALPMQLAQHGSVLVSGYYVQVFCLHLTTDAQLVARQLRLRKAMLVAALVSLVTLYALGPWRYGLTVIASDHGDLPWVMPYLTVYGTYLAWAMIDVLWMSRLAGHVGRRHLRLGLRLMGVASLVGMLYVAHRLGLSAASALGGEVDQAEPDRWTVSTWLIFLSVLLFMLGVMIPPLGARWEERQAYLRLEPLWRALTSVAPELVFARGRHTNRLRVRITEIRDVLIGPLHPYLDQEIIDSVRDRLDGQRLPPHRAQAMAEAAAVACAIEAKRQNFPALTVDPVVIGETDEANDTLNLIRIGDAFASPVVAETVKEFLDHHDRTR
ncbi:MAB_1171c family putative transporter [Actinosynnema sp. NPDC002837]